MPAWGKGKEKLGLAGGEVRNAEIQNEIGNEVMVYALGSLCE